MAGLALAMAGLTLAILVLELVVRWVTPQPLQHLRLDDELYVVNRPGARFTYARGSEYAVPITYNSWGFRGPVPTRDVPPCSTRIVLIGDSQTRDFRSTWTRPTDGCSSARWSGGGPIDDSRS